MSLITRDGFRPLFWGFVFNVNHDGRRDALRRAESFRPLFWGFVFNAVNIDIYCAFCDASVFVPSSGDLFLMTSKDVSEMLILKIRVFVPSSGDLFLIK